MSGLCGESNVEDACSFKSLCKRKQDNRTEKNTATQKNLPKGFLCCTYKETLVKTEITLRFMLSHTLLSHHKISYMQTNWGCPVSLWDHRYSSSLETIWSSASQSELKSLNQKVYTYNESVLVYRGTTVNVGGENKKVARNRVHQQNNTKQCTPTHRGSHPPCHLYMLPSSVPLMV